MPVRTIWMADALERGFTLIEMIVVTFLLALAMLGILAVFDASARINKSETQVADAQGAVRSGVYRMTRAIRMAGSGGLFVTQAVLNAPDPSLAGLTVPGGTYDNVAVGTTVTDIVSGNQVPVRPGTDLIEVRGVIFSPLIGFDLKTGCQPCATPPCSPCVGGATSLNTLFVVGDPINGQHVNENAAQRPQFEAVDAYTTGASAARPFYVVVSFRDEIHGGCVEPQASYNVGAITAQTQLVLGNTFGPVNFNDNNAMEFNNEIPANAGIPAQGFNNVRRAGILDDFIYFIDNSNPDHPVLAEGTRRGDGFIVVPLADDVEDMQIAYGVDSDANGAVTRVVATSATDTDSNQSNQSNGDEWIPNAPGEALLTAVQFQQDQSAATLAEPFSHTTFPLPKAHCPLLHSVAISLLARSKDPDPTYKAPLAAGLVLMNGPGPAAGGFQYRRRVQTLRINLRNYSTEG
jgi:prepilin-type N-terminal cleavage/methylation domain-containing protein